MRLTLPGDVPSDIQERLARIDPRLNIRRIKSMNIDSVDGGDQRHIVDRWVVALDWHSDDPRREWVKRGTTDPANAYDSLGEIPVDCPLDQVPAYLTQRLNRNPLAPAKVVDEVLKWNTDQQLRNGSGVQHYSEEVLDRVSVARKRGKARVEIPDPNFE